MNIKNFYDLSARFDKRQSFYGKAHIVEWEDNTITLRSYETDVIRLIPEKRKFIKLYADYSATTNRHIQEFSKQNNLPISKWANFNKLETNVEYDY